MKSLLAIAASLSLAAAAVAQTESNPYVEYSGGYPSTAYTTPTYAPTPHSAPQRHSSTVHEGVGRAVASIMKAYAEGQVSLAQARILIAEAEAREMQNRVINTQTFLQRKQLLEEAREAERLRKWERQEVAEARRALRERTVLYAAYQLPASQLDRTNGAISWPLALQRIEFADRLMDLEGLFQGLAMDGPQSDGLYRQPIVELCESLRDELRDALRAEDAPTDWQSYFETQKFLVGLKYEAQYWTAASDVGSRLASR